MRRRLAVVLAVASLATPLVAHAALWPMSGATRTHASRSGFLGPSTSVEAWRARLKGKVLGGPVIDAEGAVYVATTKGIVAAFDRAGAQRWTRTKLRAAGMPAIGSRRLHVATAFDVFALDTGTGGTVWQYDTRFRVTSAIAVGADGALYVGTRSGVIALGADGTERWRTDVGRVGTGAPALDVVGNVYATTADGRVVSLDSRGAVRWTSAAGGRRAGLGTPVLGPNGRIYVPARDGVVRALDAATGASLWEHAAGGQVAGLALAADGTLVFGAGKNVTGVVDGGAAPVLQWTAPVGANVRATPIVDRDGNAFVGADDGKLYGVARDGSAVVWTASLGKKLRVAAAIGLGGRLFAAGGSRRHDTVFALGELRTGSECWNDALLEDVDADDDELTRRFQVLVAACGGSGVSICRATVQGVANGDRTIAARRILSSQLSPGEYLAILRDRTRKVRTLAAAGEEGYCRAATTDADGDLVPDDVDACPDTGPLLPTDDAGCPDMTMPEAPPADLLHAYLDKSGMVFDAQCGDYVPPPPVIRGFTSFSCCHTHFENLGATVDMPEPPPGCGVWYEVETFVRIGTGELRVFRQVFSSTSPYIFFPGPLDFTFGFAWDSPSPYGDFVRSGAYDNGSINMSRIRATSFAGVRSRWTNFGPLIIPE